MTRVCKLACAGAGLLLTIFLATGCGSSSARLRLMNVYPSQSSLDMLSDNKPIASGITYAAASAYSSVGSGSHTLTVEPSGISTAISSQSVTLGSHSDSTVLATSAGTVVLADTNTAPASGQIEIRVINASSTLRTADVYIVTAGTNISGVNPTVSGLAFESASSYQTLSAGSYEVIFTVPGQTFAVIDSSSLSFSAGQIRTIVGLDGQSGGFTSAVLSDLN